MRGVFWFRNDLRLRDNRGLAALARRVDELVPVFVLDPALLASRRSGPARVRFLLDGVRRLGRSLEERGSRLLVLHGRPEGVLPRLVEAVGAGWLAHNRDGAPAARARDAGVERAVTRAGARVLTCKDRVVYESGEVLTAQGRPYAVYTPYARAWRARWREQPELPERAPRLPAPVAGLDAALARAGLGSADPAAFLPGESGDAAEIPTAGEEAARRRLRAFLDHGLADYGHLRDRPDRDGTSRLSPYLRFGAISVRDCFAAAEERARAEPRAAAGAAKWTGELIWREFYAAILEEEPRVLRESHRPEYAALRWEDDDAGFEAWCEGRTGYPIVDAGMRQLRATGWMHNRVRMLVASFLAKDLLVDWRRGEAWFQRHLVDADPASNNGGWQWAASTGTDAQPWFRIFNPTRQAERHDPQGDYVRRWVPELAGLPGAAVHTPWRAPLAADAYPTPIVDHLERRRQALRRYGAVRRAGAGASRHASAHS